MRLGQLARKLDVRPAEIADYLAQQNIRIDVGSNVRLNEDQVVLVMNHFAPAETPPPAVLAPPVEPEPEVAAELPEVEPPSLELSGMNSEEKPDLIKAPKVELAGLKVLGKIELPEPRKKEEKPEGEEENEPKAEIKERPAARVERNPPRKREFRNQQSAKNPIALQREREAQEAERKRREEADLKKQKQREHYLSKIKSAPVPTKAIKKVAEPLEEISEMEMPISRWKRFIRWWNT